MLLEPIKSNHKVYLGKGFILGNTHNRFIDYFIENQSIYKSIEDYLNSTITNAIIPELSEEDTSSVTEQVSSSGERRTFPGSIDIKQTIDKKIELKFNLKSSYFNWILLYLNYLEFKSYENVNDDGKAITYLPDVNLHIIDEFGNVIIEITYKEIRYVYCDGLDFERAATLLSEDKFSVKLAFNKWEVRTNFDKINYTSKEFKDPLDTKLL